MRILHSWLQQYINIKLKPEQLAEKLGMLGLEVEGIEVLGEKYSGFVVGKVTNVEKHPNADKLSVCKVDVGDTSLQVVCGAPNVAVGQKVVVGRAGATVPRNQHDPEGKPFVLSNVKIRGVESFGMICSEFELGLGNDAGGIMILDRAARVGQSLSTYFGLDDIAYDVEITPNRPDWLSHYGIAREIGVIVKKKAALPRVKIAESRTPISKHLSVNVIDKRNCSRFAARMIRGVKIGPSPLWLQNALRNVGLRPRNNVVDITNYVMLECGQPLHAFDYALLEGGKIIVRQTKSQGKFTTLDGKEHQLPSGAVMVCDGKKEISIAGIMGGANSEISETTVDVVLEAAHWNPSSIRRTRRALGITTDASQRFERGTDPEGISFALQRATQLVQQLAGGEVLKGTIDIRSKPNRPMEIQLRTERVNSILGTSFTTKDVVGLLTLLNNQPVSRKANEVRFRIPTHRVDLGREIDLIEEVARVFGYDNIEEKSTASIDFSHPFEGTRLADEVRQLLAGLGFHESLSYVLQDTRTAELGGVSPVRLLNPQTSENEAMRTSLVPGLLSAVARNASFGNTDLRLFEIGRVYAAKSDSDPNLMENYVEEERACLLLTGSSAPRHWNTTARMYDIFDLKGEVAGLLTKFVLDKSRFISYSTSNRLAESAIAIEINGSYAGYFGEANDEVRRKFGIAQRVFVAEVLLGALSVKGNKQYTPLPKYPKVRRDVAFIVDDTTPAEFVQQVIRENATSLLQSIELFDYYRGENLTAGKKSLAFSLDLISKEKTLTETDIEAEVRRIIEGVVSRTGAVLRSL